jgi:hypothetical protein
VGVGRNWTCNPSSKCLKIKQSGFDSCVVHRKEAKVVDLTYDCLEQMDNLILQSAKGIHLLFEKNDIINALNDGLKKKDEADLEKLKKIQEVLYKFISIKLYSEKKEFLKSLSKDEYSLLIRAYFKIVENSMLSKSQMRH